MWHFCYGSPNIEIFGKKGHWEGMVGRIIKMLSIRKWIRIYRVVHGLGFNFTGFVFSLWKEMGDEARIEYI